MYVCVFMCVCICRKREREREREIAEIERERRGDKVVLKPTIKLLILKVGTVR